MRTLFIAVKIFLITILSNPNSSFSQFGPGGLNKTSTSLELWLDANQGVEEAASDPAENGDGVFLWTDQSPSSNDGDGDAPPSPIYETNQYNGYPAINFN